MDLSDASLIAMLSMFVGPPITALIVDPAQTRDKKAALAMGVSAVIAILAWMMSEALNPSPTLASAVSHFVAVLFMAHGSSQVGYEGSRLVGDMNSRFGAGTRG